MQHRRTFRFAQTLQLKRDIVSLRQCPFSNTNSSINNSGTRPDTCNADKSNSISASNSTLNPIAHSIFKPAGPLWHLASTNTKQNKNGEYYSNATGDQCQYHWSSRNSLAPAAHSGAVYQGGANYGTRSWEILPPSLEPSRIGSARASQKNELDYPRMPEVVLHEYNPIVDSSDLGPNDWAVLAQDVSKISTFLTTSSS